MKVQAKLVQGSETIFDFREVDIVIIPTYTDEDGRHLGEWRVSIDDAEMYSVDCGASTFIELKTGSRGKLLWTRFSGGTLEFTGDGRPPITSTIESVGSVTETWSV